MGELIVTGGGGIVVLALGRGSCMKVSSDGPMISSVPISPSVSDSSNSSSTGWGVVW